MATRDFHGGRGSNPKEQSEPPPPRRRPNTTFKTFSRELNSRNFTIIFLGNDYNIAAILWLFAFGQWTQDGSFTTSGDNVAGEIMTGSRLNIIAFPTIFHIRSLIFYIDTWTTFDRVFIWDMMTESASTKRLYFYIKFRLYF